MYVGFFLLPLHADDWLSYRTFSQLWIHKFTGILVNTTALYVPYLILMLVAGEGLSDLPAARGAAVLLLTGSCMLHYGCPQNQFLQFVVGAVFLLPFYLLTFFSLYSLVVLAILCLGIIGYSCYVFRKNSRYVRNKRPL